MKKQSRKDYLSWDQYFMGIAILSAFRSKDPSTRHGCCIINPDNKRIISVGYNGMPSGDDKNYSWKRESKNLEDTKHPYVIHSEMNAILNCKNIPDLKGSIMYLFSEKKYLPCDNCMKHIVQIGISEIVVVKYDMKNTDVYNWKPTLKMIKNSKIKIRQIGINIFYNLSKEFMNQHLSFSGL